MILNVGEMHLNRKGCGKDTENGQNSFNTIKVLKVDRTHWVPNRELLRIRDSEDQVVFRKTLRGMKCIHCGYTRMSLRVTIVYTCVIGHTA